jgi:hypothetical protein
VAAGFLGIRNLCHRSIRRNLAGALVLLGAGALIVGLASYMAHYRYAIDGVLNNPQAMADATLRLQLMAVAKSSVRQTMARDFFAFAGDLNAVLIFLLGIVFGGIAAVEGYQLLDDPYPGYGAVVRLSKRARQTHEAGVRYLENQFIAVVESAAEPAEAALARAHRRLSEIKICLDTASRIIERYEKAATAVEHALFKIVMNYRDEYRRTKGTAGPPHWEEDIPRLNRELSFDIANLIAIEDRVTGEAHGLEDRVTQLKAQLAQVQAQKISRLKEYLALVDQDAVQEEAMALANLTGLRMPAPPDLNFSMGGSGEHSEESSHDAKTRD